MKKILFSLMTLVALVVMTGSANAQGTNVTPYVDGTYSYTLGGLVLTGNATATVSYVGTNTPAISATTIALTSASSSLNFTVDYTGATAAVADEYIRVEIQYDGASGTAAAGCSNYIILNVMVQAEPTIDLAIVGNGFECQNIGTATDNLSAANQPGIDDNTFTYTVTPTLTNILLTDDAFDSYDFSFTFNTESLGGTTVTPTVSDGVLAGSGTAIDPYTVTGATAATVTITMTFPTTTGVAATGFTATVANGVLNVNGGNTYDETVTSNNEATVTVTPTPTIGTFN